MRLRDKGGGAATTEATALGNIDTSHHSPIRRNIHCEHGVRMSIQKATRKTSQLEQADLS